MVDNPSTATTPESGTHWIIPVDAEKPVDIPGAELPLAAHVFEIQLWSDGDEPPFGLRYLLGLRDPSQPESVEAEPLRQGESSLELRSYSSGISGRALIRYDLPGGERDRLPDETEEELRVSAMDRIEHGWLTGIIR